MKLSALGAAVLQLALLVVSRDAFAQSSSAPASPPPAVESPKHRDAQTVIEDGTFLPGTFAARIGDQRVSALAFGGYDSNPSQGGVFSGVVEGALFNRVTLRVGYDYLQSPVPAEPASSGYMSVGLRFGLLRQEDHHINLGFFIQYKQKGFSESNGEIELAVAASYRWSRFGLYADLVYGQGFERQERDGEVRVSGLYTLAKRWNVGSRPVAISTSTDRPFKLGSTKTSPAPCRWPPTIGGRRDGNPGPSCIRRVVDEVIELLSPRSGVRVEVVGPLPTVEAERVPLSQVFMNLLGNALKHADG